MPIVRHGSERPYIDLRSIEESCEDVFAFLWGQRSVVGSMISSWRGYKGKYEKLLVCYKILLVSSSLWCEVVAQNYEDVGDLEKINNTILGLAKDANVRCFAGSNFHYISPSDKEAFEVALCIKDGKKIYDEDRRKVYGDYHIAGEEEVRNVLLANGLESGLVDQMIGITWELADEIEHVSVAVGDTLFPHYQNSGEN